MDDDDLRARLRSRDPAASLRALTSAEADPLLEDIMAEPTPTPSRSGPHAWSAARWVAAAAAAAVVIGSLGFALLNDDDPEGPTAAQTTDQPALTTPEPATPEPSPGQSAGVLVLAVPAGPAARCVAQPTPELLGNADVAFDGTVVEVTAKAARLTAAQFYAGDPVDEVRVETPPAALASTLGAVDFEEGQRYLVSAVDGQVTVCGFSGPYSAELEQLYRDAFAR